MQVPNLPFEGKLLGCTTNWTTNSPQQSLFFQTNRKLFARPSCPRAHLALLGDAGKLEGFQAFPEFVWSLSWNGVSFSLLGQMLLFVAV